MIVIILIT